MNATLEKFARQLLKDLVRQCTEPQQHLFKLLYGRIGGRSVVEAEALSINEVIDLMEAERLDWAITQGERTIEKNKYKL